MKNNLFVLALAMLTVYGCKDSENLQPDTISYKASVFVEVVDLARHPVSDVTISTVQTNTSGVYEKEYGTTNGGGVLLLKDIYMYPSTYFTASKAGYFEGSRRIYPVAGKTHFIQIILLNKNEAGIIQADAGGTDDVDDQVTFNFPPDAIVTKDGQRYSGTVKISAAPIRADDKDLLEKMPGDLTGINDAGIRVALGSFGMIAIELRSPGNELLQLKPGATVEMKMKVPQDKLTHAPSPIPMWYFDETAGYWKEQGEATLIGNEYVAQLPHFSFWNCDDPFNSVKWGATFVYENGEPVSQAKVSITILSLNATTGGRTNEDGFVSVIVPINEVLRLDIATSCGNIIYSDEIGPYAQDFTLKTIAVMPSGFYATRISGKAVDCNNEVLTDGYTRIRLGQSSYFIPLDERTGNFSLFMTTCEPANLRVKVVDEAALKESQELTFPFDTLVDAGSIQVCKDWTAFIDLEAVGRPDHFHFFQPYAYTAAGYIIMGALDSLHTQRCYFLVPAASVGTYPSGQSQVELIFPNGDRLFGAEIIVTFTEFGEEGDYLRGTVTGILRPDPGAMGGTTEYPLAGTFAVLRE